MYKYSIKPVGFDWIDVAWYESDSFCQEELKRLLDDHFIEEYRIEPSECETQSDDRFAHFMELRYKDFRPGVRVVADKIKEKANKILGGDVIVALEYHNGTIILIVDRDDIGIAAFDTLGQKIVKTPTKYSLSMTCGIDKYDYYWLKLSCYKLKTGGCSIQLIKKN